MNNLFLFVNKFHLQSAINKYEFLTFLQQKF